MSENKKVENARAEWLTARVISEGYCCIRGYLGLCKARGEKPKDMAKNLGTSPDTIWRHYRWDRPCEQRKDCMQVIIKTVEELIADEKKPQ